MKWQRWTEEEVALALACNKRGDMQRLSKKIGRSVHAIRKKRYAGSPARPVERPIGSYTKLMRRIWAEHERAQRLP